MAHIFIQQGLKQWGRKLCFTGAKNGGDSILQEFTEEGWEGLDSTGGWIDVFYKGYTMSMRLGAGLYSPGATIERGYIAVFSGGYNRGGVICILQGLHQRLGGGGCSFLQIMFKFNFCIVLPLQQNSVYALHKREAVIT